VLPLWVSVRITVKVDLDVRVRFRVYHLNKFTVVCFYQAYCTLAVRYCYVTGGV